MTNHSRKIIHSAISFALCVALLASCSNNDDSTVLPPDTTSLVSKTLLNVQVVNAEGKPVNANLTVVAGTDANDVIPAAQESQDALATQGGRVTYSPTNLSSDKETIYITASAANHLSNTIPVTIVKDDSVNQRIVINKIPEAGEATVKGIGAKVVEGADNTNEATVVTVETTPDGTEEAGKTTVSIPQAVSATDAEGETLSGRLNVVVAQFDADQQGALRSFPGGFSATIENPTEIDAAATDGTQGEVVSTGNLIFESVGFTAIEVKDDQGRIAKNFDPSTPVTVTTKIKPGTKHPTVTPEREIQVGDKIPLWSYESSTGKWSYEQEVEVSLEDGSLVTKYEVQHLSWYNLDYFQSPGCNAVLNITDTSGQPLTEPLTGEVIAENGGWSHAIEYIGDGTINLLNAPADFNVTLDLYTSNGVPAVVSPSEPFNLCQPNNTNTISVTPTGDSVFVDVTVNALSVCSNDTSVSSPINGAYIDIFTLPNWSWLTWGTTTNGTANFSFRPGQYEMSLWNPLNGGYASQTVTITDTSPTNVVNLQIPQVCEVTTGGVVTTQ